MTARVRAVRNFRPIRSQQEGPSRFYLDGSLLSRSACEGWEQRSSLATSSHADDFSSNCTVSNSAGAGRLVGRFYGFLGRKIERKARNVRKRPTTIENRLVLFNSRSTNYTASNIPGPGRLLGLFYRKVGHQIEQGLGYLADRAGFGPCAVALDIWETTDTLRHGCELASVDPQMSGLCRRLLYYTQLSSFTLQIARRC